MTQNNEFDWLSHQGEMAQLIRAFDWSLTPLGRAESWPQSLKTSINIVINCGFPMLLTWGDHDLQIYNDAHSQILGKHHPSALGESLSETWSGIWPSVGTTFAKVKSTGAHIGSENQCFTLERNGYKKIATYNYSYSPLYNENSQIAGVLMVGIETTAIQKAYLETEISRKQAETSAQELQCERENFRNLFRQTPEMVCTLYGPDHTFDFVNSAHIKALGFDATGMKVRVAQPESVEVHGILDEVYRTGVTAHLNEIPVTLGSKLRYFNLTYAARKDQLGRANGIMILGAEVTDQVEARLEIVKARQEAQLSLNKLDTIVDNLRVGLTFVDTNGEIIYMNPECLRLHQFENFDEFQQKISTFPDLFETHNMRGIKLEVDEWPINKVIRGENFVDFEMKIKRVDTGIAWIGSYSGIRVLDESGNPIMSVISVRDITSKKQVEFELKEALRVRDEFLSIASHELRTPLTSLKMQLQLSNRGLRLKHAAASSPEKLEKVFDISLAQVDRLASLIDDLLDVSRIESGKLIHRFEAVYIKSLISDLIERFSEEAIVAQAPIEFMAPGNPAVQCDPFRIDQVLTNLISNALKYASGKPIKIFLSETQSAVEMSIQDFGVGIPEEKLPMIFNRFERASADMNIAGLGLGLYITKSIVEAHRGKITVESEINKGTTFKISLPH